MIKARRRTLELLRKLVEIPSPSGEEDEISYYISRYIEEIGLKPVEEEYGVIVRGNSENFWVITHIDTVNTNYKFHFDGCYAYGTGVCDAKGSVAAILSMLDALSHYMHDCNHGPVMHRRNYDDGGDEQLNMSIAFLRDEEDDGKGSEEFARRFRSDGSAKSAVVMEPTSLKVADVHFGSLEILLRVHGTPAHGATPERGANAIDGMLHILSRLRSVHQRMFVQCVRGGSDLYAVPDACEARVEFRLKPTESIQSLKKALMEMISSCFAVVADGFNSSVDASVDSAADSAAGTASDNDKKRESINRIVCQVRVLDETEGFHIAGAARKMLESAIRITGLPLEHCEMPSWTDASNLHESGWDVAVWGPGELWRCHTHDERISLDDIEKATRTLIALNHVLNDMNKR